MAESIYSPSQRPEIGPYMHSDPSLSHSQQLSANLPPTGAHISSFLCEPCEERSQDYVQDPLAFDILPQTLLRWFPRNPYRRDTN